MSVDICKQVTWAEHVLQTTSAESLRRLDERHSEGKYRVLVVSDDIYMRGLDYRSNGKSICLVIAAGFESLRDAE